MAFFILTLRTVLRDRIFFIIFSLILVFCFVPVFSSFSMRQAQEVSITMSLAFNSFIMLFLSLFGGVSTIWRDIERKYTYTLLSYPVKRTSYLVGRYLGFAFIMLVISLLNLLVSAVVIKISAGMYKSQLPIMWHNIFIANIFAYLKYCLLMAFGFLFSTFSTSFFTPFFATISIFIMGNASQGIYDYIMKNTADTISPIIKKLIVIIYYIIPNFSAFDYTVYAAYSMPIKINSIFMSFGYWGLYLIIVMMFTIFIFNKRDFM
ncbi:ABC transporter permease [Deferribacter autotrophicus]|uniref:ABC transporter permease n=1 Tax=Deferribacter autotrophicus TaxID=500465 RepID=A0A5A8F4S0_9BACT|nr:ABC transporter permease [Deferribacter autotrophicus]KAA0259046.1 ABC transporter permease [Deferribacter autotrophicus]